MADTQPTSAYANVDLGILIDTSGTMGEKYKGSLSRLEAVKENAIALCREMEKYDDDGILIGRFAGKVRITDSATSEALAKIFAEYRPMGNTNTKEAVEQAAQIMLKKRASDGANAKPACLIVFTDGAPDDKVGLAQVIVNITKQLKDRKEFGILFVQVGDDSDATAYLAKLNNDLTKGGATLDIVAVEKLDNLEELTAVELIEMAFTD